MTIVSWIWFGLLCFMTGMCCFAVYHWWRTLRELKALTDPLELTTRFNHTLQIQLMRSEGIEVPDGALDV